MKKRRVRVKQGMQKKKKKTRQIVGSFIFVGGTVMRDKNQVVFTKVALIHLYGYASTYRSRGISDFDSLICKKSC